ncbi:MAG: DUF2283 domain-containing protein [Chloroflexi bacterium]|nr:DUF2283 domain-containing protein [Chloroflexota bacterium]
MRVNYDRQEDILMIEVTDKGAISHAEHTGPIIAHLGPEGQLVVLEILDASEFLSSLIKATLRDQEQEITLTAG